MKDKAKLFLTLRIGLKFYELKSKVFGNNESKISVKRRVPSFKRVFHYCSYSCWLVINLKQILIFQNTFFFWFDFSKISLFNGDFHAVRDNCLESCDHKLCDILSSVGDLWRICIFNFFKWFLIAKIKYNFTQIQKNLNKIHKRWLQFLSKLVQIF